MQILIKIDNQPTKTIRIYKKDRIGVQIEKQLKLPRNATENLYGRAAGGSVDLRRTFEQEEIWSNDEIQLCTKGNGGSRRKDWRMEMELKHMLPKDNKRQR